MQVRSYAGYWNDRAVVSSQPLLSEIIQGYGEVIVDAGADGNISAGGSGDFIITPRGTSAELTSVVYRELTLRNDAGATFILDVIQLNAATNLGTANQVNTGAMIAVHHDQWAAVPNDATLRVVSFRDESTNVVPQDYLTSRYSFEDTPGPSFFWSDLTFGTFSLNGNRGDFTLARDAQNVLTITAKDGVVDRAAGFERIAFKDGVLAFDTQANAGQAYRIYEAAFDRTPDLGGLSYWIKEMDGGVTLNSVAKGFINSAEFTQVYGANVSNDAFVAKLYRNILDRDGEAEGVNFWVGELNSGRADRASVLVGFSESPENVGKLQPVIDDGIWYS